MKGWLLLLLLLPAATYAGGLQWGTVTGSRYRADYVSPAPMRLRVFSPKDATVEVRVNNRVVAKGAIPFEYRAGQEGFVSVTVTLPDGKRWWGNSVRMQEKTECQLWVLGPPGSEGPTVESPAGTSAPEAKPSSEAGSDVEPPSSLSPSTQGGVTPAGGAASPVEPLHPQTPASGDDVAPPPASGTGKAPASTDDVPPPADPSAHKAQAPADDLPPPAEPRR